MNPTESKKRRSKSNQAAGEPTALDPDAASVVGADGAPDATAVACGALRASAPGAGFPTAGAHAASPWWQESSPDSSEWMYPPGGFLNYLQNNKISPFSQTHPFVNYHNARRILRHEKKWSTYLKKIKKEKDKSVTPNPTHVVNVKDAPKQRPIGHKKAKDECSGKRLTSDAISVIDHKLDKFIEASSNAEKMGEVQQSLANKKLEVANLNHKAAQEQTKGKMIDLYKDLLLAPTSDLSQEALAERSKALECMRLALFAKDN
ncbi:hypothetical protein OsJ_06422 [Oryza sativa Japonica Group]|uniref:No apical meristem-associated C-terminal domain-containing protein n=1 Tax=Oryza sativa subsp. japonica TaxID=39947 RepID=A3A611_ORYSJ|nr:hypothetical protein OsJ_06422 [Oryza sativa Japonica Group]